MSISDYSSLSSGCESSSGEEENVTRNNKNVEGDDEDAEEAIAAAEERKRIRKLRSRRDRSKNGAQFTQTLYPDFRQVSKGSYDKILFSVRPQLLLPFYFIAFFMQFPDNMKIIQSLRLLV